MTSPSTSDPSERSTKSASPWTRAPSSASSATTARGRPPPSGSPPRCSVRLGRGPKQDAGAVVLLFDSEEAAQGGRGARGHAGHLPRPRAVPARRGGVANALGRCGRVNSLGNCGQCGEHDEGGIGARCRRDRGALTQRYISHSPDVMCAAVIVRGRYARHRVVAARDGHWSTPFPCARAVGRSPAVEPLCWDRENGSSATRPVCTNRTDAGLAWSQASRVRTAAVRCRTRPRPR
jgi:hypothetical protein